jgi:hypothetical protein
MPDRSTTRDTSRTFAKRDEAPHWKPTALSSSPGASQPRRSLSRLKAEPVSFLNSNATARQWLQTHAPDCLAMDASVDKAYGKALAAARKQLVRLYVKRYHDVRLRGKALIYRAIKLDTINELITSHLGNFWSFEPGGAQVLGRPLGDEKQNEFLLCAEVQFSDIDWVVGFVSFMGFGEDQ